MVRLIPGHALLLYLAVLSASTFIHEPALLASGLLIAFLMTGEDRLRILKKSLLAMLAFNLCVSLGVVLVGLWQGRVETHWLLLANLRVLLMVYLGFWFVARVDLLKAVATWPTAVLLVTMTLGHLRAFERLMRDYRQAFTSRNIASPRLIDRRRLAAAQAVALLDKAQAQSAELAQGMKSRGAFDA